MKLVRMKTALSHAKLFGKYLRRYSIFATATATAQLALMVTNGGIPFDVGLVVTSLDFIIFIDAIIGFTLGLFIGKSLEDYYMSSTIETEDYEGKSYEQKGLKREQENTKLGNRSAYWFNFVTFTLGTFAVIISIMQISNSFHEAVNGQVKTLSTLKLQDEERVKELIKQLKSNDIATFKDKVLLDHQHKQKEAKKRISKMFEAKIKDALITQRVKIKNLNGWEQTEHAKSSNKKDGYRTLTRKYQKRLSELKEPLRSLKTAYKKALQGVQVKTLSIVEAKEQYIKVRKEELKELKAEIISYDNQIKSVSSEIVNNEGLRYWIGLSFWLFVSMLLSYGYYLAQEKNYKYEQTLTSKIEKEEDEKSLKSSPSYQGFNPNDYLPKVESVKPQTEYKTPFKNEINDDAIFDYIEEVFISRGALPSSREIRAEFNIANTKVTDFYNRNSSFFIIENGKRTEPSPRLLDSFYYSA